MKNKFWNLLRNTLRIIFLFIFLHWILWFTTYAKNTNYFEAIKDEKITKHDEKTDHYNSKGLLGDKQTKKYITEIEEDILQQIERKKGLSKNESIRIWKNEKLPNLQKLDKEIKVLEKKENISQSEKGELEKKKEEYQKNLTNAKNQTVENIKTQLKENELIITELDDNRSTWQKAAYDPLKFFLISPLNKVSKILGLSIFLEILFKSLVIESLLILMCYSETILVWESMDRIKEDSELNMEEREKLSQETSHLVKYMFFNGFMMILFNICAFIHPAHFDRTSSWFQMGSNFSWFWIFPFFFSLFLSNIGSEFLRRGHLLSKQELKDYIVKNFIINIFIALLLLFAMWMAGMNSKGSYLFSTLGGLVRFAISIIRVKFFGHREYFPGSGKKEINR
ncbi:MAG: hypothetical protein mread185_000638 [Mycoplasmataceae bacterium]|nr:MAG: hypothetical protein mread185_000638 [Mycoplasmataceae bacterium]